MLTAIAFLVNGPDRWGPLAALRASQSRPLYPQVMVYPTAGSEICGFIGTAG